MLRLHWDIPIFNIRSWDWSWTDDECWGIAFSSTMKFDLSWNIATSDNFVLGHSHDEEYFILEYSHPIGSFTLGHSHLLERDQIDSLSWSIWRVVWRSFDYFMLSSLLWHSHIKGHYFILGHSHFVDLWHWDLTFYLWWLLLMDYEAVDTLGSVFSAYLDDLRYLPTFHFILRHYTLDHYLVFMINQSIVTLVLTGQ